MTLDDAAARIGEHVSYREPGADQAGPGEDCIVTSVQYGYVFVRFDGHNRPVATAPQTLTLTSGA